MAYSSLMSRKNFHALSSLFLLPIKREDPSEKMMDAGVSEALLTLA